jgi:hypothetical protein
MDALAQIIVWLNTLANALGRVMLVPIAVLPGWLSATLIAVVCGVVLLVVFKYTSFQGAIKSVRNDMKAHLLALKLFRDNMPVVFRAQGRIFSGAFLGVLLAILPVAVMLVPVSLILGQIALWYQARPLHVGEERVLTMKLNGDAGSPLPNVRLEPTEAVKISAGPVRVPSKHEICWNIKAAQNGTHRLAFLVNDQRVDKELAVGDGFMRVSTQRPGWNWVDVLLNPSEQPFPTDAVVRSIEIDYPQRNSWTSGSDWWVYYWFAVSFISALCFRRFFNVNL